MASTIQSTVAKSSVNNGRRYPLQGFDTVVYIQDQATGVVLPFGEFTGFQHTVRNATEPYLPLGSRSISLLDGEWQIGWVAEQGKINLEAAAHCFGFSYIGPIVRLSRSPRFQIIVEYNAPELDENKEGVPGSAGAYDILSDAGKAGEGGTAGDYKGFGGTNIPINQRVAVGRYVFGNCKIDAFTSGVMAGRSVIADRIEGLAETWYYEPLNVAIKNKTTLGVGAVNQDPAKPILFVPNEQTFIARNKIPSWANGTGQTTQSIGAAATGQ